MKLKTYSVFAIACGFLIILFVSQAVNKQKKLMDTKSNNITTSKNLDFTNYQKPTDSDIRQSLTELQYKVTQQNATERAFDNNYWANTSEGIYVDIVSGEPLFSSTHKYKSGTGWPSFYQPIDNKYVVEKADYKLFIRRTEVKSKYADSHLGHVFKDGPKPTGLRYCINSAALDFVPKHQMKEKGYQEYLYLFE